MCHKFLTFKFGPQINFIIGASHTNIPEYQLSICHPRRSQWKYVEPVNIV
jgi:hypothetical protein